MLPNTKLDLGKPAAIAPPGKEVKAALEHALKQPHMRVK